MPDGTKWGIYTSPQTGTVPTANTITGSGQITMVAPLNFTIVDFNSVSGFWASNAVINGPTENPTKSYISFGLLNDIPKIPYSSTVPTLLFTFRKASNYCPDELYLIENGVDPFDQLPNSANSNPGNEITVLDFGTTPPSIYEYGENIAPFAWDCHDCDGDGIANAYEDTNGDGEWTPGVDVSDLCNGGGSGCVEITGAQLYCENGGTTCGNNPSGPLSLVIEITGGEAPFTVKYTDGSTDFTLQNYQSGSPFPVATTNGALYSLLEVIGNDGCTAEATDLSGEVPVTLPSALQFVTQPTATTMCNGTGSVFSACATASNGTFSFSWQYSADQGATWQPVPLGIVFNQTNTGTMANGCDELIIGATIGLQGYRFRAVASGDNVPTTYSQAATLTVQGPLSVATQPQNIKVCSGETVVFNADFVNNGGGDIEYTWQLSHNNGATWWDAMPAQGTSGINSNELTTQDIPGNANGDIYRLRARVGDCGFVYSQTALLTVEGPLEVVTQPANIKVCAGETVVFNAAFDNFGAGDIEYTWELSHNNGATWWDGMPAAGTSGIHSNQLTIQNIPGNTNGDIYRLRARVGDCDFVYTQSALLTVEGPLEVVTQPANIKVCAGETVVFTATFDNFGAGNIEYTWELSHNNGATWWDAMPAAGTSGIHSTELTIQDIPGNANGDIYRLRARVGDCDFVYTQTALLTVEGPVEILALISPVAVCRGEEACFEVQANLLGGGQLSYQWQERQVGSTTWTNVQGATAPIFCLANTEGYNGNCYRVLVRTESCPVVTSIEACLVVGDVAVFAQQPQNSTICYGETATLTANAAIETGYAGQVDYRWQTSTDGGLIWQDLNNDATYDGVFADALTISDVTALGNQIYRLSASTGICEATYSTAASITVEAQILFSQQPEGATVCPDEAASFSIAVSGGNGALSLQWQSSTNGQAWTDIAEGGNYSGTQTSTLTIATAAGLDGTQYRLVAASQNCSANSAAAVLTLEDAAICNPTPGYQDCVSLAVKKLDDGIGWSVWVKADSSFTETPYQLPTGGKVTLVAPIGFAFQGLTSHSGGKWKPGTVSFNPPQDPGKIYFEFNLTPNQNFLELTPGAERLLFSFSVVNGCPESLTLMDSIVPPGFSRNEFTGFGSGLTQEEIPFHFCGVYAQDEWECPPTMNLMAPTGNNTVASGQQLDLNPSAVQVDFGQETSDEIEPTSFFGVAPNPTRGELTVAFDENILEKTASLRLWNLQGQLLHQEVIEGEASHRLDLGQYVPGIYFLTLEVDGKLVQREKIIVQ